MEGVQVIEPRYRTFVGCFFSDDIDPAARAPVVMWCPDRNDAPIEGVEIAPRPVMQALN